MQYRDSDSSYGAIDAMRCARGGVLRISGVFIGCTYKGLALPAALSQTVNMVNTVNSRSTVTTMLTVDTKSSHDLPNVAIGCRIRRRA